MRMGRSLALLCLVGLLDGCSLVFVHPAPPDVQPGQPVSCTDSHVFPWIDAIYGLAALSSVIGGSASDASSDSKAVGVPIMSVAAIGLLGSAYIGFRRAGRCGELEDAYEAARARQPPYPPYGYPPPNGYPPPSGYPQQPYPQPNGYPPQPYPQQPYPAQPYPPQPQPPQQPQPPPPAPSNTAPHAP